jgi:hypothetical protein
MEWHTVSRQLNQHAKNLPFYQEQLVGRRPSALVQVVLRGSGFEQKACRGRNGTEREVQREKETS